MGSSFLLDSKAKISLSPGVSLFTSANNESLLVKHNNKIFKISARSDLKRQLRIFRVLKQPRKLREILHLLSEFKKKDVVDILHALHKLDLITLESKINNYRSKSRELNNSNLLQYHIEQNSKLTPSDYQIVLIGDGILADKLVKSLRNSNIIVNRIKSDLIRNETDKKMSHRTNGKSRSTGESISSFFSPHISTVNESDLVVVAEDYPNLELFENVNEICFKQNKPSLRASFDDNIGYVGPFVIPGKTSCFNCCELRLVTNSPDYEYELWRNKQKIPKMKLCVPAYFTDILSAVCTNEILKFLSARNNPETINKLFVLDTQLMNLTKHKVLTHPNCFYCNSLLGKKIQSKSFSKTKLSNKSMSLPDKELVRRLRELVDERTGIILEYSKLYEPHPLGIYFHHFSTAPCSRPLRIGLNGQLTKPVRVEHSLITPSPSGSGFSDTEAEIHTLMESVERYSNMVVDESRIIWSTYNDIQTRAISPSALCLYSDEQYYRNDLGCSRFSKDSVIPWIEGYDLLSSKRVMIPADFVYYPAIREKPLVFDTSNGASAHTDTVKAILNGLYEVIERDAFLTMWLNKFSMPLLNMKKLPFGFDESIKMMNKCGMCVRLVDLTNDTRIPTVAAVCFNNTPRKYPALLVGAGTHIEPEKAVQKALFEMEFMLSEIFEHPDKKKISIPEEILGMSEHPLYYLNPEMRKYWEFVVSSKQTSDLPKSTNRSKGDFDTLMQIVRLLHTMNHRVIYVDITSSELSRIGLKAVKVFVTGFQPLYIGTKRRLNLGRLKEVAEHIAPKIKATRVHPELNIAPHPLP